MEPFGSGEQLVVVRGGEGVEGGGGGLSGYHIYLGSMFFVVYHILTTTLNH